jgi:hypothetical protein
MGDIRNAPGHATSKTGDYRSLGGAGTFRDNSPDRTWQRDFLVILIFVRFIPVSSLSYICPLVITAFGLCDFRSQQNNPVYPTLFKKWELSS